MVKIEDTEIKVDNEKDDGALVKSKKPKSTSATNANLPPGTLKLWQQVFIPTLERYIGTTLDPWSISDEKAVEVLQCIWDAVFTKPKIVHKVIHENFVCKLANQRLCEWCNGFGSTALTVIRDLFSSDEDFETTGQRVSFAKMILRKQRFVWKDVDGPDESTFRGLFHSPLVLQTLAYYYKSTEGAINVPALYTIEMGGRTKPYGAIGLAAAALERAFTLWRTRVLLMQEGKVVTVKFINPQSEKEDKNKYVFSDASFGKKSRQYVSSAVNLLDHRVDRIITEAKKIYKSNMQDIIEVSDEEDSNDERANLVNADSEDDYDS
ncbi:hypothetical protein SCP_0607130 [Sparassis crispa]|uniref:DUF6532 domain-containing protein n=1 Tax=Sparassis crispa TaxID=139825 RepID=A0A401GR97_9APHY|nr:hypothetical protein SCP_0607130 [Sparassis crispa]GBE84733.1 hypothetical protein SCP_0607130 [Sparassis crispa]